MIYLDRYAIKFLSEEIKQSIKEYKIQKVVGYDADSFSLLLNKKNVYFDNNKETVIYVTESKMQKIEYESPFILKLKKCIVGSIIKDVYQYENDRVIILELDKLDMFGQNHNLKLIYELLGKSINVVLIDDNDNILTTMYQNMKLDRLNIQGSKYTYPNVTNIEGKYFSLLSEEKKQEYSNSYCPVYYTNKDLLIYNKFFDEQYIEYDSLNESIKQYFETKNKNSLIQNIKKPILKYVNNNIKRLSKILEKIPEDILENSGYEKYKEIGDILSSNIYLIKKDMQSIKLLDYYNNKDIEIKLDPKLNPSRNIEKYYNEYSKKKRKEKILNERLTEIQNELMYYNEQLLYLENESNIQGINEIAKTLNMKTNSKRKEQARPLYTVNFKNCVIYIGRNSKENDNITFNIANSNDTWMHVKDYAGSHILIKGQIDNEVIQYAAKLAIENSKLDSAQVDYCKKKYVKRMPQGKMGQVIYSNFESVFVRK